jgi:Ca2+-binding RTX toxin-like protein
MSTHSFNTDFLSADTDLDWHVVLRGKAQAHAQTHAFGLESLDPSVLAGPDLHLQDWGPVLGGAHSPSDALDRAAQLVSGTNGDQVAIAESQDVVVTPMAEIDGTAGNNLLNGTANADTINGLGGSDTINGAGGNDTINRGDGNDLITGASTIPNVSYASVDIVPPDNNTR